MGVSGGARRGAVDRRLVRYAGAARTHLMVTLVLGLAGTGLILAQAGLLARVLAVAAHGDVAAALSSTLAALLVVVAARAAVTPPLDDPAALHSLNTLPHGRQWRGPPRGG